MPVGHERINAPRAHPNDNITFIRVLDDNHDSDKALELLEAVAAQFKKICKARGLGVNSLEEAEWNPSFAGRNFNGGEIIEIVLRRRDGSFAPFSRLLFVMAHELAHVEHMNHAHGFQKSNREIREAMNQQRAKGDYGDGFWSAGKLASGRKVEPPLLEEDMPTWTCAGAMPKNRRGRRRAGNGKSPAVPRGSAVKLGSTGRQVALGRKPGGRVKRKGAFEGEGHTLSEDPAQSSFKRQAGSNSAAEARAIAAEARLAKEKKADPSKFKVKKEPKVITISSDEDEDDQLMKEDEDEDEEDEDEIELTEEEKRWMKADEEDWEDEIVVIGGQEMSESSEEEEEQRPKKKAKGKEKEKVNGKGKKKRLFDLSSDSSSSEEVVKSPKKKAKADKAKTVTKSKSKEKASNDSSPPPTPTQRKWRATSEEREEAVKADPKKKRRSPMKFFSNYDVDQLRADYRASKSPSSSPPTKSTSKQPLLTHTDSDSDEDLLGDDSPLVSEGDEPILPFDLDLDASPEVLDRYDEWLLKSILNDGKRDRMEARKKEKKEKSLQKKLMLKNVGVVGKIKSKGLGSASTSGLLNAALARPSKMKKSPVKRKMKLEDCMESSDSD